MTQRRACIGSPGHRPSLRMLTSGFMAGIEPVCLIKNNGFTMFDRGRRDPDGPAAGRTVP